MPFSLPPYFSFFLSPSLSLSLSFLLCNLSEVLVTQFELRELRVYSSIKHQKQVSFLGK